MVVCGIALKNAGALVVQNEIRRLKSVIEDFPAGFIADNETALGEYRAENRPCGDAISYHAV